MFRSFFLDKKWWAWSILGTALIIGTIWYQVQLDVAINNWQRAFYNSLQQATEAPGSLSYNDFIAGCLQFIYIAGKYILIAVMLDFFVSHYIFRWRTAMTSFYTAHWHKLRHIEGASQRIQEDTMRFAKIIEDLGSSIVNAILTLIAFLPLLWGEYGTKVTVLPLVGNVPHGLAYAAIISALFGTVILALAGWKLPGLAFKNQLVEAAYRKELVLGEDDANQATQPKLTMLFANVRKNYFTMYMHYCYFNVVKWSYLQASVIIPLVLMAPTIVVGALKWGEIMQIIGVFSYVQGAMQILVRSWSTIVELMSIYKRLKAFEKHIRA